MLSFRRFHSNLNLSARHATQSNLISLLPLFLFTRPPPSSPHPCPSSLAHPPTVLAFELPTDARNQSIAVMTSFLMHMTLHPHIFKKAQQEMDRVVGRERLPTWEDREGLGYLECVFREVLRCVFSPLRALLVLRCGRAGVGGETRRGKHNVHCSLPDPLLISLLTHASST